MIVNSSFPLAPQPDLAGDSDAALTAFLSYLDRKGTDLYPHQEEAVLAIFSGEQVIMTTPTGSGKSLVAVALHFHALALGRRSVYACPIKALVNEKFLDLCQLFGPEHVGLITGDAKVNPDAPIICCTAEILMLDALRFGASSSFSDVVLDEFHYYGDPERGTAWQVPLLVMAASRFLLMSATLGPPQPFVASLQSLSSLPVRVVHSRERPVPLDYTYLEQTLSEAVDEIVASGRAPVYVVAFTQRECAENAQSFVGRCPVSESDRIRLREAMRRCDFASPAGKDMRRLLASGVGLHHAGMLPKYRVLVEKLAQEGLLKIICGTDTLGVGVNVPIRSVVLTKLCKFNGQKTAILSARDFHQIAGRAGRKGFDERGSVFCLAPAHVVENRRREQKAAAGKKKIPKVAPPSKNFVMWNEARFVELCEADPEPLVSHFRVDHAMIISVLSRSGDNLSPLRELLRRCHESPAKKNHLRRRGFQLLRSLVSSGIVELPARGEHFRGGRRAQLHMDLQDDFSLHESLAMFLLRCLPQLDPLAPDYPLALLSLSEAIVENPRPVLLRQVDRAKGEAVREMKEEGLDYHDRLERLEDITYPKPMAEWIYHEFEAFCRQHPWVEQENIRPKSVAREMFEGYYSFSEYVRELGLERCEGVLLRHLSSVLRVLRTTLPHDLRTDATDDVTAYLDVVIRSVDSSLLDEWRRLSALGTPGHTGQDVTLPAAELGADDSLTRHPRVFIRAACAAALQLIRPLAHRQIGRLAEIAGLSLDEAQLRAENLRIETLMAPFYDEFPEGVVWSSEARRMDQVTLQVDGAQLHQQDRVYGQLQLLDAQQSRKYSLELEFMLAKTRENNQISFRITRLLSAD